MANKNIPEWQFCIGKENDFLKFGSDSPLPEVEILIQHISTGSLVCILDSKILQRSPEDLKENIYYSFENDLEGDYVTLLSTPLYNYTVVWKSQDHDRKRFVKKRLIEELLKPAAEFYLSWQQTKTPEETVRWRTACMRNLLLTCIPDEE